MKKIQFIITLALSLIIGSFAIAQPTLPTDPESKKVSLRETIGIDTLSQQELYDRASEWMTHFYKTNKFDVNDKIKFHIVHEANFPLKYKYDFKYVSDNIITYNMYIDLKEGKYRYTLTDFKIYDVKIGAKSAQALELYFQKMKTGSKPEFVKNFNNEVNIIIEDMKKYMSEAKIKDKDDW